MDTFEDLTSYDQYELAYSDSVGSWANYLWENCGIDITNLDFEPREVDYENGVKRNSFNGKFISQDRQSVIKVNDVIYETHRKTTFTLRPKDIRKGQYTTFELGLLNGNPRKFCKIQRTRDTVNEQELNIYFDPMYFSNRYSIEAFGWEIELSNRILLDTYNPNLNQVSVNGTFYYVGHQYDNDPKVKEWKKAHPQMKSPILFEIQNLKGKPLDIKPNGAIKHLQGENLMPDYFLEQHDNVLKFIGTGSHEMSLEIKIDTIEYALRSFMIPTIKPSE